MLERMKGYIIDKLGIQSWIMPIAPGGMIQSVYGLRPSQVARAAKLAELRELGLGDDTAVAMAWDYARRNPAFHNGVDFTAPAKDKRIFSVADAYVLGSAYDELMGWYVATEVRTRLYRVYPVYCHLREQGARVGTELVQGEVLGFEGASGFGAGEHLHFQVQMLWPCATWRKNDPGAGRHNDPEKYLPRDGKLAVNTESVAGKPGHYRNVV